MTPPMPLEHRRQHAVDRQFRFLKGVGAGEFAPDLTHGNDTFQRIIAGIPQRYPRMVAARTACVRGVADYRPVTAHMSRDDRGMLLLVGVAIAVVSEFPYPIIYAFSIPFFPIRSSNSATVKAET